MRQNFEIWDEVGGSERREAMVGVDLSMEVLPWLRK